MAGSAVRLESGFLGVGMHTLLASPEEFGGLPLTDYGFHGLNVAERTQSLPRVAPSTRGLLVCAGRRAGVG